MERVKLLSNQLAVFSYQKWRACVWPVSSSSWVCLESTCWPVHAPPWRREGSRTTHLWLNTIEENGKEERERERRLWVLKGPPDLIQHIYCFQWPGIRLVDTCTFFLTVHRTTEGYIKREQVHITWFHLPHTQGGEQLGKGTEIRREYWEICCQGSQKFADWYTVKDTHKNEPQSQVPPQLFSRLKLGTEPGNKTTQKR